MSERTDPDPIQQAVEEALIGQFDSPLLPLITAEGQLRARVKRIAETAATRAAELQREVDARLFRQEDDPLDGAWCLCCDSRWFDHEKGCPVLAIRDGCSEPTAGYVDDPCFGRVPLCTEHFADATEADDQPNDLSCPGRIHLYGEDGRFPPGVDHPAPRSGDE